MFFVFVFVSDFQICLFFLDFQKSHFFSFKHTTHHHRHLVVYLCSGYRHQCNSWEGRSIEINEHMFEFSLKFDPRTVVFLLNSFLLFKLGLITQRVFNTTHRSMCKKSNRNDTRQIDIFNQFEY